MMEVIVNILWDIVLPIIGLLSIFFVALILIILADDGRDYE